MRAISRVFVFRVLAVWFGVKRFTEKRISLEAL